MALEGRLAELQPLAAVEGGCVACGLRSSALFAALGEPHLHEAAGAVSRLVLEPGAAAYRYANPGTAVFTLRSGIVRFERVTAGGKRRILRLAGRGALIGQEALLQRPYADDAIACTPVELCAIPRSTVERLAQDNRVLLRELMQRWQCALDAAHQWGAEMTAGSARSRVLRLFQVLLQLSPGASRVWLPARMEMSDMLDIAEETASRMVTRLRREGILQVEPAGVARIDAQRLQLALQAIDT